MAESERKRQLAESSDSEDDQKKTARIDEDSSASDLTEVTDSESSSDSDSSGSSSSSSSSSGSDETSKASSQGKVKLGKQKNGNFDPSPDPKHPPPYNTPGVELSDTLAPEPSETLNLHLHESSTNSQHSTKKNSQNNSQSEQNCQNSSLAASDTKDTRTDNDLETETDKTTDKQVNITTNNSADILLDTLADTSFNTIADNSSKPDIKLNNCMETEADNCLETGADNCLETGTDGNFNLDEIQQFLAGGDDGFVDPVFVDHEDSQNAADLDQLVFETEKDNQEEVDDFLNDPRLGIICSNSASLGTSKEGSVNLNEFEDGELESTPEPCLSLRPNSSPDPSQALLTPDPKHSLSEEPKPPSNLAQIPSQESILTKPDPVQPAPKESRAESKPNPVGGSVSCSRSRSKPEPSSRPSQSSLKPALSEPESDHEHDKSRKRKKLKKRRDVKVTGSDESDEDEMPRTKSKKKRKDKSPNHSTVDKSKPRDSYINRNKLVNKVTIGISGTTAHGVKPGAVPEPVPGIVPRARDQKSSGSHAERKHSAVTEPQPGQDAKPKYSKHSSQTFASRDNKYSTSSKLDQILPPPLPPVVAGPPQPKLPAAAAVPAAISTSPTRPSEPSSSNHLSSNSLVHINKPTNLPGGSKLKTDPCDASSPAPSDDGSSERDCVLKDPAESMEEEGKIECPRKKLSLKDYKAKKEAELARKSAEEEESSSEHLSQNETSKEPSPEPCKRKKQSKEKGEREEEEEKRREDEDERMEEEEDEDEPSQKSTNAINKNSEFDDGLSEFLGLGFDILDQIENDSETDSKSVSSGESMDEEVYDLLEQDVVKTNESTEHVVLPEDKFTKLVLEDRGGGHFDVLPLGWVIVHHHSGMPVYLHKDTRVITLSRPYDLGVASVRRHNIPISSIPCYAYRYSSEVQEKQPSSSVTQTSSSDTQTSSSETRSSSSDTQTSSSVSQPKPSCPVQSDLEINPSSVDNFSKGYKVCPFTGGGYGRENVSPDSTTIDPNRDEMPMETDSAETEPGSSGVPGPGVSEPGRTDVRAPGDGAPGPQMETIEETRRDLTPLEVQEYCRKVFTFKEVEVARFKSWKERRKFHRQEGKRRMELERPQLPEGTKVLTIPTVELTKIDGTEGDSAMNQQVVKKSKKQWVLNPNGKSMVCILHEYVQQSLKSHPNYKFAELDNAATPYSATVYINEMEYGRGVGSSKKVAKSRAARQTLEMMLPTIKDKLPEEPGERGEDEPDLKFFNDIRVEDPRVAELCNRASEPGPFHILVTCLQRNYGVGDTGIQQDMKSARNGKMEYIMSVNKREVSVICKNKKDGKQLAAQKMLQQLHPNIGNWGSLLRMYGNRATRRQKQKKMKESEVLALQSKSSVPKTGSHSIAILAKLKDEMRNLRDIRNSVIPLGKFQPPAGVRSSGLGTDHLDI